MADCELMAIGDSLFNGVRSLTIAETLAAWSALAQLAKEIGASFATPASLMRLVQFKLNEAGGAPSI